MFGLPRGAWIRWAPAFGHGVFAISGGGGDRMAGGHVGFLTDAILSLYRPGGGGICELSLCGLHPWMQGMIVVT